jgi:putative tributyrin esterase
MGILAAAAFVLAGCAQTPAVQPGPVPGGRVEFGSFHAAALKGTERYAVFLPAGYDTSHRHYPVIYALHGLPNGGHGYASMPIDEWGRAAQHAGYPAIIVAPAGARPGDTDPEWHDWGPGRNWESVIAWQVVNHIDSLYRTIPDRSGRALIGISAGGYGATLIGLHHPGRFSVIQSWSGYFHPTNPDGTAPLDVGTPEQNAAASAHTYVPLARKIYARWHPSYFAFYVGDADSRFLAENEQLHDELLKAHVPHTYAVYPGGHTRSFWAAHENDWVGDAVSELAPAQ